MSIINRIFQGMRDMGLGRKKLVLGFVCVAVLEQAEKRKRRLDYVGTVEEVGIVGFGCFVGCVLGAF